MPSAREERTLRIGWWWWVEKEGWMYGRERNPPREQTDRKEREREEKEKSGIDTREKEERERVRKGVLYSLSFRNSRGRCTRAKFAKGTLYSKVPHTGHMGNERAERQGRGRAKREREAVAAETREPNRERI